VAITRSSLLRPEACQLAAVLDELGHLFQQRDRADHHLVGVEVVAHPVQQALLVLEDCFQLYM
jgi:hypothetical protein